MKEKLQGDQRVVNQKYTDQQKHEKETTKEIRELRNPKTIDQQNMKEKPQKRLESCDPQKTMISKNRKENNKETFTDNLDKTLF